MSDELSDLLAYFYTHFIILQSEFSKTCIEQEIWGLQVYADIEIRGVIFFNLGISSVLV